MKLGHYEEIEKILKEGYTLYSTHDYNGDKYYYFEECGAADELDRSRIRRIALSFYGDSDRLSLRVYSRNNVPHRPHTEGPALESWWPDGTPRRICYREHGARIPGIEDTAYYIDGTKE